MFVMNVILTSSINCYANFIVFVFSLQYFFMQLLEKKTFFLSPLDVYKYIYIHFGLV